MKLECFEIVNDKTEEKVECIIVPHNTKFTLIIIYKDITNIREYNKESELMKYIKKLKIKVKSPLCRRNTIRNWLNKK